MDYHQQYQEKLMTAEEAVRLVRSGENIIMPMMMGQPLLLVNALADRADELEATLFSALDLMPSNLSKLNRNTKLQYDVGYPGPPSKAKVQLGDFNYTPIRILDDKCWEELRPMEVVMFVASSMDDNGYFTMGTNLDYTYTAMRNAKKIIIEVNDHMPRTCGVGFLHISEVTAIVENHRPLIDLPLTQPDDASITIGNYIADLVEDGSCLQLGIGALSDGVATCLEHKKDLGIHTELFTDSFRLLWEKGAVTNRKKNFMKYVSVASFAFGSQKLYDFINNNPSIQFFPASFTNDPHVIAKNDKLISINSALSIDLTGQVNAESFGPLQYAGVGGNLDFVEGAWRSNGGKSFIALNATAKNGSVSKIVPQLEPGSYVSTGRADVHYIVTEYGIALLKGQSVRERAKRLIAISHPDFRDQLTFEAGKMNLL